MKRLILFLSFVVCALTLKAQVPTQVVTSPGTTYVYVGSLTQNQYDTGNSQKLVVKIFGGSWFSDSNGETSYYISNRDGLSVKTVSLGSGTAGRLTLRAYQNGASIDFYLLPSPTDYTSFAVSSYTFGYAWTPHYFDIFTQTTVPPVTDITASLNIKSVMTTDPEGNIGIGVADAHGYKLGVNGNVHAKQVVVDMNDWPDYVFSSSYDLPSLKEVKEYIVKNSHLPGFPAASDVSEKGLQLGETSKQLTKKVEELTLYLIEKDEQLLKQEKINKALRSKIEQQDIRLKALEQSISKLSDAISLKSTGHP